MTNQQVVHEKLEALIRRRAGIPYDRPISPQSSMLFDRLARRVGKRRDTLVIDAGCGNGTSTERLAGLHPGDIVVGIDKSARLLKYYQLVEGLYARQNFILARMDLVDFWRLAARAGWHLRHHYLLYPNPWPKRKHLNRRWHAHPVFPDILRLGGRLEVRSNWRIFVDEFALAVSLLSYTPADIIKFTPQKAISSFESKYAASSHDLYRCTIPLG